MPSPLHRQMFDRVTFVGALSPLQSVGWRERGGEGGYQAHPITSNQTGVQIFGQIGIELSIRRALCSLSVNSRITVKMAGGVKKGRGEEADQNTAMGMKEELRRD